MEEELIEFIRRHRFLYDKNDGNYKNTSLRKEKFQQLSKKLNIPAQALKDRWRTLRDKYNKEIKTNRSATQRKWKWMDKLSFLTESAEIKDDDEDVDPFESLDNDNDFKEFRESSNHASPVVSIENNKTFQHFIPNNVPTESTLHMSSIDIFFQGFAMQAHEANLTNIEFSTLQIGLLQTFNDFLKKRTNV